MSGTGFREGPRVAKVEPENKAKSQGVSQGGSSAKNNRAKQQKNMFYVAFNYLPWCRHLEIVTCAVLRILPAPVPSLQSSLVCLEPDNV